MLDQKSRASREMIECRTTLLPYRRLGKAVGASHAREYVWFVAHRNVVGRRLNAVREQF
ncbi:hypothetical protein EJ02DRAFT_450407, partial [Clathrospora elynae]